MKESSLITPQSKTVVETIGINNNITNNIINNNGNNINYNNINHNTNDNCNSSSGNNDKNKNTTNTLFYNSNDNNSNNNSSNNNNNNNNITAATPIGTDLSLLTLTAVCYQSLGQFKNAVNYFSKILIIDQLNCCWYQREIALYIWSRLDRNYNSFCIDDELDPRLKDGWCKRMSWRQILQSSETSSSYSVKYVPFLQPKLIPDFDSLSSSSVLYEKSNSFDLKKNDDINYNNKKEIHGNIINNEIGKKNEKEIFHSNFSSSTQQPIQSLNPDLEPNLDSSIANLVRVTAPYGVWLQLRCVGFLPNQRQVCTGTCTS